MFCLLIEKNVTMCSQLPFHWVSTTHWLIHMQGRKEIREGTGGSEKHQNQGAKGFKDNWLVPSWDLPADGEVGHFSHCPLYPDNLLCICLN